MILETLLIFYATDLQKSSAFCLADLLIVCLEKDDGQTCISLHGRGDMFTSLKWAELQRELHCFRTEECVLTNIRWTIRDALHTYTPL